MVFLCSTANRSVRCICSKPSPKSCLAGADAFSKLSATLVIILRELGEQDELVAAALRVPVPPVLRGAMRCWTEWAGELPEPLFAYVWMSEAASQLASQPLARHLWKCWCFRKLCQPLLTPWEIESQSQKDTDVLLPYSN